MALPDTSLSGNFDLKIEHTVWVIRHSARVLGWPGTSTSAAPHLATKLAVGHTALINLCDIQQGVCAC